MNYKYRWRNIKVSEIVYKRIIIENIQKRIPLKENKEIKYKGVPKIVCKRIIIENKQKMVQLKNKEIKWFIKSIDYNSSIFKK